MLSGSLLRAAISAADRTPLACPLAVQFISPTAKALTITPQTLSKPLPPNSPPHKKQKQVTPAHDPNDFATGKRHGLETITIFDDYGRINDAGGPFKGQPRFAARVTVVDFLKEKGLYRGVEDNAMRLGLCSRSKDVIEPVLKPQWCATARPPAHAALNPLFRPFPARFAAAGSPPTALAPPAARRSPPPTPSKPQPPLKPHKKPLNPQ